MSWCTNIITICLLSWSLPLLTFIPVVHSSVHYCLSGNMSEELSPDYRLRECLGIKEYTAYRSKGASPTAVRVDIKFQYFDIMDVDDWSKTMYLETRAHLKWKDQRLAWSPQFYEYIDEIYTDPKYIWKPEFIIQYNLMDRARQIDSQARIPNDADPIEWFKVYNSKTFCSFDYVRYPFDTVTCKVKIEHALGDDSSLIVSSSTEKYEIEGSTDYKYLSSSSDIEWSLIDFHFEEIEVIERPGYKAYFALKFVLARNYSFHLYIIIFPSIILSVIIIFILWIPHHSKQRLVTGVGLFFSILFITSNIHRFMPTGVDRVTCLVAYMVYLMFLLSITMIISLFTERMFSRKDGYVPDIIQRMFFNGLVSFLTGVPLPASTYPPVQDPSAMFTFTPYPNSASSSSSGTQEMSSGSPELKKMERIMGDIRQNLVGLVCGEHLAACDEQWRSLSRMVDRLAFEIFMLMNVFMTAVIYLRL